MDDPVNIDSVTLDFEKLFENHEDYNVKIIVGEEPNVKEFKAHKFILTSRSDYFKSALSLRWERVENGINIFKKPNISPSVFETLLKYIYTGVISVENNEISLVDIIIASDELQLLELCQQLEKRLLEDDLIWKPRDFIAALGYDHFTKLYDVSMEFTCRNPKIIFESEDFFNMKEAHLINLLKCDDLELDEIEIWEYLIQWGIENTDSILYYNLIKWTPENFTDLKNTLRNCIPHIRFFHMSHGDYIKLRAHFKDILPDGLDDEITRYFSDPNFKPSIDILPLRKYLLESNIIDAKDAGLIASWIDRQEMPYHFRDLPFKFKLIYRASRDGFKFENFHKNCDNRGPTLVVIKVYKSGEIVGGFNPLEWGYEMEYKSFSRINSKYKISDSFIFSLTNRETPILSRVSSKELAILCCEGKGPCFGLYDLLIDSTVYRNYLIFESKVYSYEKEIIDRGVYKIEDYEVFQIIDERLSTKMSKYRLRLKKFLKL
ncbi:2314_t:CDS:2 [Acaulospora morrowiae]|uniref:2314_t:CDS:1 n=1 Tax=Acaulospora morrowiae TaxID=94023 RepID=A0A9N8W7Y5_9GLOM|nr:2314_t:CDS:2 [Acaulospora morrowiae]